MNLTYYYNASDKRYVNKSLTQIPATGGHANPVEVVFIENTSLLHPTFKMKDVDVYMTSNYVYVDDLRRYYFIDNITFSRGYAYLQCTCDVLYTWRDDLKKQSAVVRRQEKQYNLYQVDDKVKLLSYNTLRLKEFPSGFDENKQEFVLCTIGNTTS